MKSPHEITSAQIYKGSFEMNNPFNLPPAFLPPVASNDINIHATEAVRYIQALLDFVFTHDQLLAVHPTQVEKNYNKL